MPDPKLITAITFIGAVIPRDVQSGEGTIGTSNILTTAGTIQSTDLGVYFSTSLDTATPALTINRGTQLKAISFSNAASQVNTEVMAGGSVAATFTHTNTANDGWGDAVIVMRPAIGAVIFSLPTGTVFPDALQTITLSTTAGYSIFYTTNGSTPTASSSRFVSPIPIAFAQTINAISVAPDGTVSSVFSASFTISAPAVSGSAAGMPIFWKTGPSSDFFTSSPSPGDLTFMASHIHRMMMYPGVGDSHISTFPPMWVYRDSSSIYDAGFVAANPGFVYRDAAGHPCFINYGPQNPDGTYAQYLPDHGNAAFRTWWVTQLATLLTPGYVGVWLGDVNLDMNAVIAGGAPAVPIDPRTSLPLTTANYQKYLVEFMETVRADFPTKEIAHVALFWNAGGDPSANTFLTRQIQACDYYNIERGFGDSGIVAGFGTFGLRTIFNFIDQVHGLGRHFIAEQTPGVDPMDYFPLACSYLVSDGTDMFQATEGQNPLAWPAIDFISLGTPLAARYDWNGLIRRDFASGSVFVAEPGRSGGGTLSTSMVDPLGNTISSLSLTSRQGAILLSSRLLSSFGPGGSGGNDTALLQAAINATAAAGQKLVVDYVSQPLNTDPLNLPSNTSIALNTGAIIQATSGYTALQVMLTINAASNVTLAGTAGSPGVFRMLKSEYTSGEFRHCLGLYGATNVTISNLQFNDSGGDGMYISGASDTITVSNSVFNNDRRNGLSIISGRNVSFTGCSFTNTNGTAPEAGIDLEPNGPTDRLVNIQFTDCTSTGNNGNGVLVDPRNLHASSAAVSATFLRHASQSNGNSGFQVTNEQDGLTGTTGTITFQDCTSHLEQFYAFKANFYNSSGPQVHVTNLSAVNPNRSGGTVDNAAVGIVRGGGGTGPIGNILITGLAVTQTLGGLTYYFTLADASGPSYATIEIDAFGSLSGATGGSNGVQDGVAKTTINIP